ncbi:unnamed protein product, partial [Adineta ricciae]
SSPQRRKHPNQAASLLPTTDGAITTNGHSDFESGDEIHHHSLNGYTTETFTSTTAINVDSDTTSTSSQTSSEHDPQITPSTIQTQTYNNISPNPNWSEERTSFFATNNNNNLASSQSLLLPPPLPTSINKPLSQTSTSINTPVAALLCSPKLTNNNLLTESTNNNHTVKNFDQIPEYKLFSSNNPPLHNLLFCNNENGQQSHRPLINGIDHDVREIEKRLLENGLNTGDTSYSQTQENDELGFDPCSLFMSALAPDIEDERRPLPSTLTFRSTNNNSYNYPIQYPPTTNSSVGQINPNWLLQQQQYQQYHDQQQSQPTIHSNGTMPQKQPQQQQQQQQQQRYPISFNGSSPRQMWNGNQQQSQYPSQLPIRLDFSNQNQQRLPPRQPSPSTQYSQPMNNTNNTNHNTYSSNNTVTNNTLANDRWQNLPWTDPAIISFGSKLDPVSALSSSSSQWSTTTQSQGSSTMSSGTNLIPTSRWSQQQQSTQSQSHLIPNGIYSPYSTAPGVDHGNRS